MQLNVAVQNIVPLTRAREELGMLTEKVSGDNYILLTKGGEPEAILVDVAYFLKLQEDVKKIYQKTFINPALIKYTREFSDEEIAQWLVEDKLP